MSDLLTDEDLRTEREPVKEPAKNWVNWWRSLETHESCCGPLQPPNTVYAELCVPCGVGPHPSRDVAETWAHEMMREDMAEYGRYTDEYLGAFPEGERP